MSINNLGENLENKNQNDIFKNEKIETKVDVEDILKFQEYKKDLENIIPELQKIGLKIDKNGSLNFENVSYTRKWPKINGKSLIYFPTPAFNRKYNFGDKYGNLKGKKDLAELFRFLGFNVDENIFINSNEKSFENIEYEKKIYRFELEKILPDLEKIGLIINQDGSLNFQNLKGNNSRPKVNGKNLNCFPSATFNKKYGIGNEDGMLINKEDLQKLFIFLGFNIKNENIVIEIDYTLKFQEYKKNLENIIPELQKIGVLIEKNGNLNFNDLKGYNFWPKINGKKLINFPTKKFNIKYGIGNEDGLILNKKELAKLFSFLGFSVNIDEEKGLYFDDENYILETENINNIIDFSDFDPDNFSIKKEDF